MSYSVFQDRPCRSLFISTLAGPNTTPLPWKVQIILKMFLITIWPLFKAFEKNSNRQSLNLHLFYEEQKRIIPQISQCPGEVKSQGFRVLRMKQLIREAGKPCSLITTPTLEVSHSHCCLSPKLPAPFRVLQTTNR